MLKSEGTTAGNVSVGGNETIGGTLSVTGTTTTAAINASGVIKTTATGSSTNGAFQAGSFTSTQGNVPSATTSGLAIVRDLGDVNSAHALALIQDATVAADIGGGLSFGARCHTDTIGTVATIRGCKEIATTNDFSGYIAFSTRAGVGDNTEQMRLASDGDLRLTPLFGTPPSATGVTVNKKGSVRTFVHKVTVSRTALTAAAATQDIVIWTTAAKTKIQRVIMDVTAAFTGGGTAVATISIGPNGAETTYMAAKDAFAGAAVYGDADSELGTALAGGIGDIPSWSGTTAIEARFTSDTTVNVYTTGSVTFHIEGLVYL